MGNYHGYKCRNCGKELDGLQTRDIDSWTGANDEEMESWTAIYFCPDGHGQLELIIEQETVADYYDEIHVRQEIVSDKWIEKSVR